MERACLGLLEVGSQQLKGGEVCDVVSSTGNLKRGKTIWKESERSLQKCNNSCTQVAFRRCDHVTILMRGVTCYAQFNDRGCMSIIINEQAIKLHCTHIINSYSN